jgi:hypothetical protein
MRHLEQLELQKRIWLLERKCGLPETSSFWTNATGKSLDDEIWHARRWIRSLGVLTFFVVWGGIVSFALWMVSSTHP